MYYRAHTSLSATANEKARFSKRRTGLSQEKTCFLPTGNRSTFHNTAVFSRRRPWFLPAFNVDEQVQRQVEQEFTAEEKTT